MTFLVPNWKRAWRWMSVWFITIVAAMPLVWMEMPPEVRNQIPDAWLPFISIAIFVIGLMSRLKNQGEAVC